MFKFSGSKSILTLAAVIGMSVLGASSAHAGFMPPQQNQNHNDNHNNGNQNDKGDKGDKNDKGGKGDDKGGLFNNDKGDKGNDGYGQIDNPKNHDDKGDKGNKGDKKDKGGKDEMGGKDKNDHHYDFCWNNVDKHGKDSCGKDDYCGTPVRDHGGCQPATVPLPAAAWSGLATLAGGVVAGGYRKARRLMA